MRKSIAFFCRRFLGLAGFLATIAEAAPSITQQPEATVIVTSGEAAMFSAQATGTGTIRWQWRRMGGALAGQTGPTLSVPSATMAEVGFYDVVVSDDTGSTTSQPSRLLVTPIGGYPNSLRLDTSFNPHFERDWGDVDGTTVGPDGEVYVFGSFSSIAGEPHVAIARFSADLVVDSSFRSVVKSSVNAAIVQSDGKPILLATIRRSDGSTVGPVVRLNRDGSDDDAFNPGELRNLTTGESPSIWVLAKTFDEKLLIGGRFDTVGSLTRYALARLNPDGSPDPTFNPDLGRDPHVDAIVSIGEKVVLLGRFVVPERTGEQRLVRLNRDGSLDLSFEDPKLVSSYGLCLSADASGRLYIGARFNAGVYPKTDTLIRLLGDGSIDPTYQCELDAVPNHGAVFPDGRFAFTGTYEGPPKFGCLDDSGAILWRRDFGSGASYSFPRGVAVAGTGGFYVAAGSPAEGSPFMGSVARYSTDGVLERSAQKGLRSLALPEFAIPVADGKWVVAGAFDYANGYPVPGIARLSPDGTTDTTFKPASLGLGGLADLVTQGDGAILAVGGGQAVARRLLRDGQLDTSFAFSAGAGFGSSNLGNMAVLADGRIVASGWISAYNGEALNTGLVVIQANGAREPSFAPIFQPMNSPLNRLVAAPNGGFAFCGDLRLEGYLVGLLWMTPGGGWIYPHSLGQDFLVYGVCFDASGRLLAARSNEALRRVDGYGSSVPTGPDPALIYLSFVGSGITAQTDNRVLIEGLWRPSGGSITHGPLVRLNADDSLDTTFRLVDLASTSTPLPNATMQYTDDGRLLVCGGFGVRGGVSTNGLTMFKPEVLPPPPVITRQPVAVSARLGDPVELSVEATGEILNYRWYRNNSPKAIGRTLVLPSVAAADFGSYTAEVLGPADSVKSVTVQISQRVTQPFAAWIAASNAPIDQRGALDSPAGDGVPNLVKYALGISPSDNAGTRLPTLALVEAHGMAPTLALVFAKNPQAEGIRYVLEVSADLGNWSEAPSSIEMLGTNPEGAELVRMIETSPTPGSRRFARLKVVQSGS